MTSEGMVASLELATYLLDLVKEKRQRPDDRIISRLIEVSAIDADGVERRLSDDDVAGFSVLIAGAGRRPSRSSSAMAWPATPTFRSPQDEVSLRSGALAKQIRASFGMGPHWFGE
jgi:cytochrome P450